MIESLSRNSAKFNIIIPRIYNKEFATFNVNISAATAMLSNELLTKTFLENVRGSSLLFCFLRLFQFNNLMSIVIGLCLRGGFETGNGDDCER